MKCVVLPEIHLMDRLKIYLKNGGNVVVIGANATRLFDDVLGITDKKEIALSSFYLGSIIVSYSFIRTTAQ